MLPVAFLAEKAVAGAAEGHRLLGRISATFVTCRKDLSLAYLLSSDPGCSSDGHFLKALLLPD